VTIKSSLRKLAPRSVRPHRILGGPLRGRIIVTSYHDYPAAILGRTEAALLAWFKRTVHPGETWLDVGAHYGYTAIALAELVGPNGHVFAFEPELSTAGHLNRTRELNHLPQLRVMALALGGPGDLRLASVRVDRGMANHSFGGEASGDIFVVGFDELWPKVSGGRIHGVKIDVQGMELDVLTGMREHLAKNLPHIAIEFHAGVERRAVLDLLAQCGYRLPGMAVEPLETETEGAYHDDRSYVFEALKP